MIFGGADPMKTKKEMKNTNKGFTLIELIVTVAIIAIFSGVILTFVTTGSNTYRSTSSTAKVQMETQETFDRIEDMIINVNRSLYYANVSGKSIGSEIKDDIKIISKFMKDNFKENSGLAVQYFYHINRNKKQAIN